MYAKELTLHNPRAALIDDYATAVRLAAAGRINLEPIVTDTLALDDVAAAFAVVDQPDSLKVLLRP
jgi:threonine dehydrogenase-like Zn-dependent dehydrogenase